MSGHTPGPWETLLAAPDYSRVRIFSGSHYIGSVSNSDDTPEQRMCDARLIAAAPELLDALTLMSNAFIDTDGNHGPMEQEAMDAARAAIAKATGGEA